MQATAGTGPGGRRAFDGEVRFILQAAMALFVYTVVIGILNGTDLVDFERKPLLAHVHVGTLGWLTMAVFAGSLALFGEGDEDNRLIRYMAWAAPVVVLAYNVAFLTTTGMARPILGTVTLAIILVFFAWAVMRARVVTLSVPHLGVLAGLATSATGAVLGVLLGILLASPDSGISTTVQDAHPATMVVGFLVPVAMAFVEWVARPASVKERATRLGQVQVALPFAGGVILVVALLAEIDPLAGIATLFEIVGLAILIVRLGPALVRVSLSSGTARFAAFATPFFIVNIGLLTYLIANYIEDFEAAPTRLLLAMDHSIFVGVLTNLLVGWIVSMSGARRPAWVDSAVFWGLNLGVAGFIVGLIADSSPIIRVATPVLGLALLTAIVVHVRGLGDPRTTFARPTPAVV
ncbi:MAG: hypothetical protein H6674_07990 [Dehalococcoidia bacterium]|nr:hypothetical protein [Dehalococcoidia bacterium]